MHFGRYRKKPKSLDYEKSVSLGEKKLGFLQSALKIGPEFVVRPLFFSPFYCVIENHPSGFFKIWFDSQVHYYIETIV